MIIVYDLFFGSMTKKSNIIKYFVFDLYFFPIWTSSTKV